MRVSPYSKRYASPNHTLSYVTVFPQVSRKEQSTVAYQQFSRQLFHACLTYVYSPLKPAMTVPKVVQCPDGHFRRAVYSIGPYIADYPEQVWLTGIVQNWCPKYAICHFHNACSDVCCASVDVMLGLVTWTTSWLISERTRRLTYSSTHLTLVLFGTSMAFGQMLWYVKHNYYSTLK
jgi:hypothetical protein